MSPEMPFGKLLKYSISLKNTDELEKRKIQYDLLLLEGVLRAHVGIDGNAKIIAGPKASSKEILAAIPARHSAKVLSKESMDYKQLLSESYN